MTASHLDYSYAVGISPQILLVCIVGEMRVSSIVCCFVSLLLRFGIRSKSASTSTCIARTSARRSSGYLISLIEHHQNSPLSWLSLYGIFGRQGMMKVISIHNVLPLRSMLIWTWFCCIFLSLLLDIVMRHYHVHQLDGLRRRQE